MVEQPTSPRALRLGQLLDVASTRPAAGQLLLWDAAAGRWSPSQVASAGIADGSVTTSKLANGAVTAAKVAADVATQAELDAHTTRTDNPHAVTAAQAGAATTGHTHDAAYVNVSGDTMSAGAALEFVATATGAPWLRIGSDATRVFLSADASVSANTLPLALRVRGGERLLLDHNLLTVSVPTSFTAADIGLPNVPSSHAYKSVDQAFAAATWTKIVYDTEIYDSSGNYDPSLSRFVAPVTGWYDVTARLLLRSAGAVTNQIMEVYRNGVAYERLFHLFTNSGEVMLAGSAQIKLTAADYIEIFAYTATAVNSYSGQQYSTFTVRRAG